MILVVCFSIFLFTVFNLLHRARIHTHTHTFLSYLTLPCVTTALSCLKCKHPYSPHPPPPHIFIMGWWFASSSSSSKKKRSKKSTSKTIDNGSSKRLSSSSSCSCFRQSVRCSSYPSVGTKTKTIATISCSTTYEPIQQPTCSSISAAFSASRLP
jgi:hypothetical protein